METRKDELRKDLLDKASDFGHHFQRCEQCRNRRNVICAQARMLRMSFDHAAMRLAFYIQGEIVRRRGR